MRKLYSSLQLFVTALLLLLGVTGASAKDLIDGHKRVLYPEDLKEGKAYFIISDRTKFAGNSTGKPKAMSPQLESYKIKWGTQYVYWGDFDAEEEAFQWVCEKVDEGQWAFKNKVNGLYLGRESGSDNDVIFSETPVGYTLTDLEDGEGRFYMISSEDPRSPHVQGFVRSDRPNNSLGKQDTGFTTYVDDVATNGYPARWHIYEAESSNADVWITDVSQIQDGVQYYIVSDRTKFAGNSTGLPKAMSTQQESYTVKWGTQYVYWGDLDKEADGFVWTAKKADGEEWAFLNKENGKYLGNMNTSPAEADVVFSDTPVGYTLSDLTEGAGRFYMTNSESEHSLHVQGYLRSNRPNNSLAKQNVGDDDYSDDVATNGYPGRWKLLKVSTGEEEQPEFYTASNGYYYITGLNGVASDLCWADQKADALAYTSGASLIATTLHSGDPRSIFYIEAVDRQKGQYRVSNYATGKYVTGEVKDGYISMADEATAPLTFRTVPGNRKALCIFNAAGDMLDAISIGGVSHISPTDAEYQYLATWKLQKLDAAQLESPAMQLRLALAKKMDQVGNPDFTDHSTLDQQQLAALRKVWEKADEALTGGTVDILYERHIADLDAAAKGEYAEPVYNKYKQQDLRVLSYNVRHCAENHGNLNLSRTASVIAAQQADVVALQEVDSVFSSRSDNKYQVKELAEATGMYGIFCSALTGYGIGILSKQLPLSVKVVALASDFEPRRMLIAEFENYVFASLHVGLSANARRGTGPIIKAAAEEWVETGKPLIIAGDFNDDGTDSEMEGARGVLTKYLQENGFTFHSDLTTPTWSDGTYVIDNIISYDEIGGVEKLDYKVIDDKVTSDHMPILGELRIGFKEGTGIGSTDATHRATTTGRVYNISGAVVSSSADGITALPSGIYIVDGKKLKK